MSLTTAPDFSQDVSHRAPVSPPADGGAADVRAAQQGDADAFARLYERHMAALFAVCVGLTGNRQDAGELVQDTFVRAWEAMATFRGDSAFGTWLHRIAVNQMLTDARSARRRAARVAIEADLQSGDGPSVLASGASNAPDALQRFALEDAVNRLPPGCRSVFVLHTIAGYSHAEIAEQLGIAEGTCKAHLFRARRLLRGMLER